MKTKLKYYLLIVLLSTIATLTNAKDCIYSEQNGLVVIEAEDLALNADWKIGDETTTNGFAGSGYIYWDGADHFGDADNGIIEFKIQINNPGIYTFHWHNKIGSGTSSTDFNDSWFKVVDADEYYAELNNEKYYAHGSGNTPNPEGAGDNGFFKVFSSGTTDWTWRSTTSDNEGYDIKANFAQAGVYTLQIAARSTMHLIDRIVLYAEDAEDPMNLDNPAMACESLVGVCSGSYSFAAISDFPNLNIDGFKPAIIDQDRQALAIDAAIYKDKFAAASMIFNGNGAKYDIRLNTLTETDGESSYKLYVNSELVGTYQNPENDVDYTPSDTTFKEVAVLSGDTLLVLFNSHTNGKIPEGDGTAYSRGRWTSLELICTNNGTSTDPEGAKTTGEIKRWHPVTITFNGPNTSEVAEPNPFTYYKLDVRFTHKDDKISYTIPGYYAACGYAADSSCTEGNKWRIHFSPDRIGEWNWTASFLEGANVVIGENGVSSSFIDGLSGSIDVIESDKAGRDFRAADKGKLQYVGKHYLRHKGTNADQPSGNWFIKAGADAPENTLDFMDFDQTPNRKGLQKTWEPHQNDYSAADASKYTWQGGKGRNILGMINYLSDQGMNVFSFHLFNLAGDDQNVFPHLLKESIENFEALADPAGKSDAQAATIRQTHWEAVYHDRFDISKMAQWEQVFSYADKKGMYLHFKLGEEENETLMDGGDTGKDRMIFYRELIARFGHHLALNWNIGEENGPGVSPQMNDAQRKVAAAYFKQNDPYHSHIVTHSRPDAASQNAVYTGLLADTSFTGASLQCVTNDIVHSDVLSWLSKSNKAGKPWVVCNDEQGPFPVGVGVDATYTGTLPDNNTHGDNRDDVRKKVLWGTLLAGGGGVEYYYGYQTGCTDLNGQDHRTRESKWKDAKIALDFFNNYFQEYLPNVVSLDSITSNTSDYVLAKKDTAYLVYLPNGGSTSIELPEGTWLVQWYNTRSSGGMSAPQSITNEITAPTTDDWLALITKDGVESGNLPPSVKFQSPENKATFSRGSEIGVIADASDIDGSIASVALFVNGKLIRDEGEAPYEWGVANEGESDADLAALPEGEHVLTIVATDDSGLSAETSILIIIKKDCPPEGCPREPRFGDPIAIPGMIQAEDFDLGEEGETYHDTDTGNSGETCCGGRPGDNVDTGGGPNGYAVAWTSDGEWLEYSVNAEEKGNYQFAFDLTSGNATGAVLGISVDGKTKLTGVQTPGTGDWDTYETVVANELVGIAEGEHIIRLTFEKGGSNIDQFEVTFINGDYTEINDKSDQGFFKMYPNPINNLLNVDFASPFTGELAILDLNGKYLMKKDLNSSVNYKLNTDFLANGSYILQISNSFGSQRMSLIKIN